MKFKKGDKIVCIDNDGAYNNLTLNKIYTVVKFIPSYDEPRILLFENNLIYYKQRFKLLSEIRKEKIKQLKNGI